MNSPVQASSLGLAALNYPRPQCRLSLETFTEVRRAVSEPSVNNAALRELVAHIQTTHTIVCDLNCPDLPDDGRA